MKILPIFWKFINNFFFDWFFYTFARKFRWKFNNSGETLDMDEKRYTEYKNHSILRYTPVTDQVSLDSGGNLRNLVEEDEFKMRLAIMLMALLRDFTTSFLRICSKNNLVNFILSKYLVKFVQKASIFSQFKAKSVNFFYFVAWWKSTTGQFYEGVQYMDCNKPSSSVKNA
jgi:hypothetical protein